MALLILDSMDIIVKLFRHFCWIDDLTYEVLISVILENSFLRMPRSLGWSIVNAAGNKQI